MNTWAPRERICMCTHSYTQAWYTPAHACAPYVQSLSHKPYEVTSTHIHAHMEMEKGRSRQGRAELGKGQLPQPLGQGEEGRSPPQATMVEADPGFQPSDTKDPTRSSDLAVG